MLNCVTEFLIERYNELAAKHNALIEKNKVLVQSRSVEQTHHFTWYWSIAEDLMKRWRVCAGVTGSQVTAGKPAMWTVTSTSMT